MVARAKAPAHVFMVDDLRLFGIAMGTMCKSEWANAIVKRCAYLIKRATPVAR